MHIHKLMAAELRTKVSLVDALVVRSATRETREVFEAARGRLRDVGRAGVGIDNVDLQAATVLDLRRLAEPRDGGLCPPACARTQIVR